MTESPFRLSVIIPCHNEEKTVGQVLVRLGALSLPNRTEIEVVMVDDGSRDGTWAILERAAARDGWKAVRHETNLGKGEGIRTALREATGDVVIIQDADMEYDPSDIPRLLSAYMERNGVSAIYGSRNLSPNTYSYPLYYWGGRLLTAFANAVCGLRLTDAFTGYKLIATDDLRRMGLEAKGFEFCAEATVKLSRLHRPIVEVPISYESRSFESGKKIRASDGARMAWTFVRHRFWTPARP